MIYTDVGARDRAALVGAGLLVAEGRVEREVERAEVPITHLICRRLTDRTDLLRGLGRSEAASAENWDRAALLPNDEVKRPAPGSARPRAGMPGSRDFR